MCPGSDALPLVEAIAPLPRAAVRLCFLRRSAAISWLYCRLKCLPTHPGFNFPMWHNYLRIAVRTLQKQAGYTFINIVGLTLGLTCYLLLALFIQHELSYDRFHENADRIYRVPENFYENGQLVEASASVGFPVGPALMDAFPGALTTRFYQTFQKDPLLAYEEKRFYEERFYFTDSTVFDIFTIPFVRGNPETALDAPFSVVLTESMAAKYFGLEDPLGKLLRFEDGLDLEVTGVVQDAPANAHFQYGFLAALQNIDAIFEATGNTFGYEGWYWNPCHTYIMLPEGMSQGQLEAQWDYFETTFVPERMREFLEFYLQPLTDIHLHSDLYQEMAPNGSMRTVQIFVAIALIILVIAGINFMNLSTARSMHRAREVGMRKVLGAHRGQLMGQFLGESLLLSFLALILALTIAQFFLPVFEHLIDKELARGVLDNPLLLFGGVAIAFLVGLSAGLYPAFFLSAFKPIETLKGQAATGSRTASWLRQSLVAAQFAISIALLAGTAVIYVQLGFLQNKDLGFEDEAVVMVPIRGTAVKADFKAFKDEISKLPGVVSASAVSDVVGNDVPVRPFGAEGFDQALQIPGLFVDFDFLETFDIDVVEGRGFDRSFETDRDAFLLNEAAVDLTGWHGEAIGKRMRFGRDTQVIGVTNNFHYAPLRQTVRPLVISFGPSWYAYMAVRIAPTNVRETIEGLGTAWQQFEPARPFEPFFLDERLDTLYRTEERFGLVFGYFAGLAIAIACLGLFGLAAYTAERRTKEIGVRKVLGATTTSIVALLSRDFTRLVLIAFVVGAPLAFFGMQRWLEGFAYRIDLSPWPFLVAGLLAFTIALLTVSYQSISTAMRNPVDTLRHE